MQRIARHLATDFAGGAELAQQIFGMFDGGGGGLVEPFEIGEARAHRVKQERIGREIFAQDLRYVVFGSAKEVLSRVEADRTAGTGASRASGALIGARLADARDLQRRQAR